MQTVKIDVNKFNGSKFFKSKEGIDHIAIPIDANNIFRGDKGLYLNLTLMDNRDGPDQYGNDGFVVQSVSKEEREAGKKGPIVGNWKHVGQKQAELPAAAKKQVDNDDDIPF